MSSYFFAALMGSILTAVAQLLLKTGAKSRSKQSGMRKLFTNRFTIVGYGIFVLVTLLNLYALKEIPLIQMVFFVPLSYLLVILASRWVLGEVVTKSQWLGLLLLLAGLITFNL